MKKTIIWIGLLVVVLVLAGVGYSLLSKQQSEQLVSQAEEKSSTSSEEEAVMLPDFTVLDAEGNPVESSALLGKPTIINFWATWCGYCKKEMPDFQARRRLRLRQQLLPRETSRQAAIRLRAFRCRSRKP